MVLVGVICSPHGLKGLVKIRTFTSNPLDICSYGPVTDGTRKFNLSVVSVLSQSTVISRIEGVSSRSESEALRNVQLYVSSSQLPTLEEDEFYTHDLIGMDALLSDGEAYGVVSEVFNFGSCDIIEILLPTGKKVLLPFTPDVFVDVDKLARRLTLVRPEILGSGQ